MDNRKPQVGDPVFVSLEGDTRMNGQTRAAHVCVVFDANDPDLKCNLRVILDGSNDTGARCSPDGWMTSVRFDPGGAPGTWRFTYLPIDPPQPGKSG